jgi:translocator protein
MSMQSATSKIHIPTLLIWILVFEAVSACIGMSTQSAVDGWYAGLVRPSFAPPNIVFPVMWSILYALIASTGYLLWLQRTGADGRAAWWCFVFYMAFNWSWSFVFFTGHQLLAGLIWIVIINLLTLVMMRLSWRQDKRPVMLLIPVLCWTLFAAALNAAYWWLNR